LTVFRVGFQIRGLNLFTDKLGVFWNQIAFQVLQRLLGLILRELLALNLLLQHVEQMHRVGRYFGMVEVEYA
jgi:hypothetical protein